MILAALTLLTAAPTPGDNVHNIYCYAGETTYQGTGWFLGDGIMATTLHVVSKGTCKDATTNQPLQVYAKDSKHDFALVAGSKSQTVIKYYCQRPKEDELYISYGYSSHFKGGDFWNPIPMYYVIDSTNRLDTYLLGLDNPYPMRKYIGKILAGMSGGPVISNKKVAYALNNAGNQSTTYLYDLADTALCTSKWD